MLAMIVPVGVTTEGGLPRPSLLMRVPSWMTTPISSATRRRPRARRAGWIRAFERSRTPATKAGLKEAPAAGDDKTPPKGGDVIVRVAGRPVRDMADVSQAVASRRVGDSLVFEVIRGGKAISTTLTLANRPADVR